jgi:hypothetical protein
MGTDGVCPTKHKILTAEVNLPLKPGQSSVTAERWVENAGLAKHISAEQLIFRTEVLVKP